MALSDYSGVAANNATVLGVNIGENTTAPSAMNNAVRQLCADIANGVNLSVLGTFLSSTTLANARSALGVPAGSTSLTAFGNLTNTANSVPYMTGSDAWALATLTSFGRSLIDDGDAATALATLGVALSGGASAGSFTIGTFKFNWVDGTAAGETSTSITFHSAFTSWSRAWCNGGNNNPGAEDNDPFVVSSTTTAASVYNAQITPRSVTVFAIGV